MIYDPGGQRCSVSHGGAGGSKSRGLGAAHTFPCMQSMPVRGQVRRLTWTHEALRWARTPPVALSRSPEGGGSLVQNVLLYIRTGWHQSLHHPRTALPPQVDSSCCLTPLYTHIHRLNRESLTPGES